MHAASAGPLAGKIAIVTGSSRSIGASIAQRLAADGAHVVINYHRVAMDAERTAQNINSLAGGRAIVVRADVSTIAGGKDLLDECVSQLGVPDILVLNAGVMGHTPLASTTERDYDAHINTNVKGPLFMVQAAAQQMKEGQFPGANHQFSILLFTIVHKLSTVPRRQPHHLHFDRAHSRLLRPPHGAPLHDVEGRRRADDTRACEGPRRARNHRQRRSTRSSRHAALPRGKAAATDKVDSEPHPVESNTPS